MVQNQTAFKVVEVSYQHWLMGSITFTLKHKLKKADINTLHQPPNQLKKLFTT